MNPPFESLSRRQALGALALSGAFAPAARRAGAQTSEPSVNVLYYGSDQPLAAALPLRAGPLTMVFEPNTLFLRYIRLGDREVLRGVYAAVRDRNWGTVVPAISGLKAEIYEGAFRLSFTADCRRQEIHFVWRGEIQGETNGTVTFRMDGKARSTFQRNRIGFCVLHPIKECAGRPFTALHVNGSASTGAFPLEISPHQPVKELRAITHEVDPGVSAEVRFEGEVFEMEDQRNWTDASYKTYCTPLGLPFPVEVKQGSSIVQAVTLSLKGRPSGGMAPAASRSSTVTIEVTSAGAAPLPEIGLGVAGSGQPLTAAETERLKALRLSHLRVEVKPSEGGWESVWAGAAAEARRLAVPLEAALFLSDSAEQELAAVAGEWKKSKPAVARWLIFHVSEKSTGAKWPPVARRILGPLDPRAQFGAGTDGYFAELNRERPALDPLDIVCYPVNPQVHAFDDATLVETLEGQSETVKSARRFCGNRALAVSPVTFKPRSGRVPPDPDPRQASLFGAAWTLGSVKHLAESGARAVTYFETAGRRGVMERAPGGVFPLYHALADVGEFSGGQALPSSSSAPLEAEGLVLRKNGRLRVLLANYSGKLVYCRMSVAGLGRSVLVKRLDEFSAARAMRDPDAFRREAGLRTEVAGGRLEIALLPYSLVRADQA
jgi:hypothetical protein